MSIRIPIVLLLIIASSCTTRQTTESMQDSVSTDTIQSKAAEPLRQEESPQGALPEVVTSDTTSKLDGLYSDLYLAITDSIESFFQVPVVTSEYESRADVIWYFDKSFAPRYFKETWSMEGTEGSTEYIIENDRVVCALENESYGSGSSTTKWCTTTGGIVSTWKDGTDDPENTLAPDDFGKNSNEELSSYMSILKALLKDGEIKEDSDNVLTIRLENTINIGEEVTQYTEVRISRVLYDELN